MMRGTAEVWAHNQMQAIIDDTSTIPTFEVFIKQVKDVFRDPDHSRTAHTKLHDLRMSLSMSEDAYIAQFEIWQEGPMLSDGTLHGGIRRTGV